MHGARTVTIVLFAVACGHTPAERPKPRALKLATDVAGALQPCPAGLTAPSVDEVLAKDWPADSCVVVQGELTATVREGAVCDERPLADHHGGRRSETSSSRCPGGWVLYQRGARPAVPDQSAAEGTAAIRVVAAAIGDHEPFLLPLQRCNKNGRGGTILPRRARFDMPLYGAEAAAGLNRGLAEVSVVVVGQLPERHDPAQPRLPLPLWSAYACRIVDAPAAP